MEKQKPGAPTLASDDETTRADERVDEIIACYIDARKAGEVQSPDEILSRYPEFQKQLEEFFANEELFMGVLHPNDGPPCFGDDYQVMEEIDGGGEGIVYKVYQKSLNKIVAIKAPKQRIATPADTERLRSEARRAAQLSHPNIVAVHQVAEYQGQPFFVMDYVEGKTLADRVADHPLPSADAARQMKTIAEAVHYAHQRQILHSDLKPANVLLDEAGKPYIADFGLAKRLGRNARYVPSGAIGGTAGYMAPEQVDREALTTATDVYGIGATLYHLLTGVPVFRAKTLRETLQLVREAAPKPPSERNPAVDKDLEAICMKCLRKDSDQRYGSAYGVAMDLGRYLAGEETTARAWPRRESAIRWIRRHPAVASAVSAVVLISLLTAAMALSIEQARRDAQLAEALQSNSFAASDLARTALLQLRDWGRLVEVFAADNALSQLLERNDRDGLQRYAKRICQAAPDIRVSCFVLNKDGFMVGREGAEFVADFSSFAEKPFNFRDYFQGTLAHADLRGRSSVHISKAYRSLIDGLPKFSIAAPVLDRNGKFLGVISTSLTTDATIGLAKSQDSRRKVVLVAPSGDVSWSETFVILVHPAYHRGIPAVEFPDNARIAPHVIADHAHELDDSPLLRPPDDNYVDPVGSVAPEYRGRWIAASAPVGNTGFFVIVQQFHEDALTVDSIVTWNLAIGIALTTCLAIAIVGLVLSRSSRLAMAGGLKIEN